MRGLIARLSAWPAYRWVCVMLLAYFAIALAGTWINFVELHFNAIGTYDLSVNQQSLSSTIHGGKPYPFYEATNCGRNDRCSYLLVHPVLFAYPVAAAYAVGPGPFTLFAIQDAALALAALPLFGIARHLMRSDRWALVAAGVYLAWMPAFSGIFSFHWEAFIPVEIFTIFWLWLNGRYALALPLVVLAYVTLEITPVLLFFIAVFFLIPYIGPAWRLVRPRFRSRTSSDGSTSTGTRAGLRRIGSALRKDRLVRASMSLLAGSVVAYILLHEFVRSGGWLLGLPPLPAKYHLSLAQPVYAANFTVSNFVANWPKKLVFWLVMFGTLAMVPLLAPRTFVIAAPWIAFTLLATSSLYRMGNQYSFIGASVLMIGFVYGLAQLKLWMERPTRGSVGGSGPPSSGSEPGPPGAAPATRGEDEAPSSSPTTGARPESSQQWVETHAEPAADPSQSTVGSEPGLEGLSMVRGRPRRLHRRSRIAIVGTVLTGILVFNLFFNPLNPWAAQFKTNQPFAEQASLGLGPSVNTTGYQQVQKLLKFVGPNSIIAVAPELFPLVADDRFAYPLLPHMNASNFPFNAVGDTQFVLLAEHGGSVPAYLSSSLYDPTIFGARCWVTSTYLGPIVLFERGYAGPMEVLGAPPTFADVTYSPLAGLSPGPAGVLAKNPRSSSGYVIETLPLYKPHKPGRMSIGEVFHTPPMNVGPGTYHITVTLSGYNTGEAPKANLSEPVVWIQVHATADRVNLVNLTLSDISPTSWTVVSFNITLPSPVFAFEVRGWNEVHWFTFSVDNATISAVTDSGSPVEE